MDHTIVGDVLEVATEVGSWFIATITQLEPVFWNATSGLTFIGSMAVCGFGIAVILLVLAMIRSYLQLRA